MRCHIWCRHTLSRQNDYLQPSTCELFQHLQKDSWLLLKLWCSAELCFYDGCHNLHFYWFLTAQDLTGSTISWTGCTIFAFIPKKVVVIHYLGVSLPMDSGWTLPAQPQKQHIFYFIKSVFWYFLTKIQQVLGFRSSHEISKPDSSVIFWKDAFSFLWALCMCFLSCWWRIPCSICTAWPPQITGILSFFSFGCE